MGVRQATPEDALGIATAHTMAWQVAYQGLVSPHLLETLDIETRTVTWHERLSDSASYVTTYVYDDATDGVVGFVSISAAADEDLVGQAVGEVKALYLHPNAWGKGCGKALMVFAMEELRQRGYQTVVLWVLTNNLRAQAFYEKGGFRADGATKVLNVRDDEQHVSRYRFELTADDQL